LWPWMPYSAKISAILAAMFSPVLARKGTHAEVVLAPLEHLLVRRWHDELDSHGEERLDLLGRPRIALDVEETVERPVGKPRLPYPEPDVRTRRFGGAALVVRDRPLVRPCEPPFVPRLFAFDPVQWWNGKDVDGKLLRDKMPHLYLIAMAALASQPTSANCERDFSASGLLVSDLRTRLSAWRIDAMVFLQRNRRSRSGPSVVPGTLAECKRKDGKLPSRDEIKELVEGRKGNSFE
jgi:hypothetical protein